MYFNLAITIALCAFAAAYFIGLPKMTRKPVTIVVTKKDRNGFNHAYINGEPLYRVATSNREDEAIGALIRAHPGKFPGINIAIEQ